jgi:ergothioneine biosynthesis glutamate--cysteine ligase EgtA
MTSAWVEGPEEPLSEAAAEAYVASTCFKTGPPGILGLELEFVVLHDGDWSQTVDHDRVLKILDSLPPLPAGGRLTLEPGGQVELSTRTAPDLNTLLADARTDLAVLRSAFAADGIELVGTGLDPFRSPRRLLDQPRYVEMERCFDRWGTSGRTMMCSTAAVQITVEAGLDSSSPQGFAARWDLLHEVGPTLVAAFANSPLREGRPTGWKTSRQQAWLGFDPSRTRPVHQPSDPDPREVYARYALDAGVLLVRGDGPDWQAPPGLTFRDWVRGAWRDIPGLRPPVLPDLEYHLTTLFPPVRARGPVEVRYIDAQDGDAWRVPAAVVSALLDDDAAADEARAAASPVADRWEQAARLGLEDPQLAKSATACLTAARDGLVRLGAEHDIVADVESFLERYTLRGRSPAADLLDEIDLRERQTC